MEKIKAQIKEDLIEKLNTMGSISDDELLELIEERFECRPEIQNLSLRERNRSVMKIFNSLRKLGVIQELIDDNDVTEILINGPRHIFYEKNGALFEWPYVFESNEELLSFAQMAISSCNRTVSLSKPIVDARLEDGSRINVVLSPISTLGTAISIRRFPDEVMTMERLVEYGSISSEISELLQILVKSGYNIFISGGTGSGKTTFLNALSNAIPEDQRVITIEDSAELQLKHVKNLVSLETRVAYMEGVEEISIRDLIRTALRMRPDRIIVGECRGAEALDMLQALNTGHSGSLSTGHANSAIEAVSRLEVMASMAGEKLPMMAIRGQIASGVQILIHLGRLRDKSRKVLEISEIDGMRDGEIVLNKLFEFQETGETDGRIMGEWVRTGSLKNTVKMKMAGLL